MTSPAPREPLALPKSVRAVFELLDADPKLEGKGLSEAFARSFPGSDRRVPYSRDSREGRAEDGVAVWRDRTDISSY